MNACAAIVEALYVRERTGKGRAISTSLFDGLAEGMPVPLTETELASYCQDERGRGEIAAGPGFSSNSLRCAHRGELDAEISAVLWRLGLAGLTSAPRSANVAFGKVNTVGQFARRSQLRGVDVDTPTGNRVDSGAAADLRGRKRRTRSVAGVRRAWRGDATGIRRLRCEACVT